MIVSRLMGAVHVAAAVLVATDTSGPLRTAVLTVWVLIVPGWGIAARLRVDVATRIALAVSTSLALVMLVSVVLVLADRYRFETAFWALFVLVTPPLVFAALRQPPDPLDGEEIDEPVAGPSDVPTPGSTSNRGRRVES